MREYGNWCADDLSPRERAISCAVANACGRNRLAVVVPCHRVIREDGSLGGYRWGVERKRTLLAREGGKVAPR